MKTKSNRKISEFKAFCQLISFSYDKICQFLKKKYGIPKFPYFSNNQFKSKPHQNLGNKGLVIHHYYEKSEIMLCNKNFAKKLPFSYQEPQNLIICNQMEHLLLHLKIWAEYGSKKLFVSTSKKESLTFLGIGGVVNFIVPQIIEGLILGVNFFKKNQRYRNELNKKIYQLGKNNIEKFIVELFKNNLKEIKSIHGAFYPKFRTKFNRYVIQILKKHKSSNEFKKNIHFQLIKVRLWKGLQILREMKLIWNLKTPWTEANKNLLKDR